MISSVVRTVSRDPRNPRIHSRLFHVLNKLALLECHGSLLCELCKLQSVLGLRATAHRLRNSSSHTHAVSPHKSHPLPPAITLHAAHPRVSGGLWHRHHQGAAQRYAVATLLRAFQCVCVYSETTNIKISIMIFYACL